MGNLRRYYYANKTKIWKIILVIAFILIIIQIINLVIRMRNNNAKENIPNNVLNNIENSNNNIYFNTDKSAVTGENVNKSTLKNAKEIIEEFISDCNKRKIEEAYNFLSKECKEELYPSIGEFKNNYIDKIFESPKISTVENWRENIYKINLRDDIIATGNTNSQAIQDYITIVNENGERKINLNEFIEKENLNRQKTIDNLTFKIISKKVYLNYEEYTIKVENKNNNIVILDTQSSAKSIYLKDNNDIKYYSYSHELLSALLKVGANSSTQINIKFSKTYSNASRNATSIVFSDVILQNESKKEIKIEI